jgi:protein gp37
MRRPCPGAPSGSLDLEVMVGYQCGGRYQRPEPKVIGFCPEPRTGPKRVGTRRVDVRNPCCYWSDGQAGERAAVEIDHRAMAKTTIEWTDATWNPVRGCVKVSPGCKHCYAEAFASRFEGTPGHPYEHGFVPRLVPAKVKEPFAWSIPTTVFVNSMSDLFQEAVPTPYIRLLVDVMMATPWHVFQVLTKRHKRMRKLLEGPLAFAADAAHIWWGVSAEDRKFGLPRIEELKRMPARVKFVSAEPLLENLGIIDFKGVDWVIVGGESGRGARAMEESWVTNIRDQCLVSGSKFFFKQWGGVHKKAAGRVLGGRTWDAMPMRIRTEIPTRSHRRKLAQIFESQAQRWETADVNASSLVRRNAHG